MKLRLIHPIVYLGVRKHANLVSNLVGLAPRRHDKGIIDGDTCDDLNLVVVKHSDN